MNTQHDITVSGKPLNPPKPPAKPHMLLWIDTETTGLDPNQCELLEVGMQVTDLKAETRGDSLHLTDQAIGRDPYQNHAGTHRVQDCIHRDINDYTAYLDIMRAGHQGTQS